MRNLANILLGMFLMWVTLNLATSDARKEANAELQDNAKAIVQTPEQGFYDKEIKRDTFLIIPLGKTKKFFSEPKKLIQEGKIKVTKYNGPKF